MAYPRSMPKPSRRSPLRSAPLRQAGASVQADINRLVDVVLNRLLGLVIVFAMWGMALVHWWFPIAPGVHLGLLTLALVGTAAWALPTVVRALRLLRALRLGRDGERIVADHLSDVAHDGLWVVHDLLGEGFNLDHVLVGTQGVFAIETKTFSKPASGDVRVRFDGTTIRVDGITLDRDPLVQARAQAGWMQRTLLDLTGQRYPVRPVVVFPGWFVERSRESVGSEVWVLEPKELRGWLRREPHMLPPHAVQLVHSRLKLLSRQAG
jgi:hypothetical protein